MEPVPTKLPTSSALIPLNRGISAVREKVSSAHCQQHNNKHHPSSNHKPPNLIISATSKTIDSLLFMTQGVNGYTPLSLFCGDTVMYPANRPNIQTLVRQIEELGYLVEVHPYPNSNINLFPNEDWIIVIKFVVTFLQIIPIPFRRL
jgi:hypothetical protein